MDFNTSEFFSKSTISGIGDSSAQSSESETAYQRMFSETHRAQRTFSETILAQMDRQDQSPNTGELPLLPIEHEGLIASAKIANSWERGEIENNLNGRTAGFNPREEQSVSITVHEPAHEVGASGARAFHDLLIGHAHHTHALSPGEIRAMEPVMNMLNLGDNQYTNPARPGDRYAPAFRLDTCQVMQVNQKPVLDVSGSFVDRLGVPTTMFRGIIIERDLNAQKIQGVTFETPNLPLYRKHVSAYDAMLKSIHWTDQV